MPSHRSRRRVLPRRVALLALAALAACGRGEGAPPAAEFLVAAGDSSYWVRTGAGVGADGVELRRAPLFLARVDGRFYELYVTEEDYSFHDAAFLSQTVWRRDLLTGDSAVVFGDATVPRLALGYARAHPDERPLERDEPGADEPVASASLEVGLVDVLGRYLTIETFADLHPETGPEVHHARRRVVDVRTGAELTLAALVGDSVEARVVADGRAAFARARDSVLRAPGAADGRMVAALRRFRFDERSFALTRVRREPGIVFYVPGDGEEADGHVLPLAPIRLPAGDWWREASGTLPHADADDAPRGAAEWRRGEVALLARAESGAESLVLRAGRREWELARLGAPAERVYWLDEPSFGAPARRALARAFSEAALYGGEFSLVRADPSALRRPRRRPAARPSVAPASPTRHAVRPFAPHR